MRSHRTLTGLLGILLLVGPLLDSPLRAAVSEDPAQTRMREAYLKSIDAEWAETRREWDTALRLHEAAAALFGALKRDYPGWQTELLERRIAESHNRAEQVRLQAQSPTPSATPPASADADRLERLLEELTRVRALLADTADPAAAADSAATVTDRTLIASNRWLRAENEKLNKRLRAMDKQRASRTPAGGFATNSLTAALIRDTARTHIQAGRQTEAIDLLAEAAPVFPQDEEIVRLLASAYCRASRFREAIRLLEDLPDPTPESLLLLGSAHLAAGQLGPARRVLENCLERRPESAEASYNMAQLLLALTPPDIAGARSYYAASLAQGGARDPRVESQINQATLLENIRKHK